MNVDFSESLDVDHSFDIEDSHFSVPAKCRCSRATFRDTVIDKLVVDPLAGYQGPGEKQLGHAGIGLDIVSEEILNRLVPAEPEPARPRTLDCHFRRRDHEKHVNQVAETGQQLA